VVSVPNDDSEEEDSPGLQPAPGLRRRYQQSAAATPASSAAAQPSAPGSQDEEYEEDEEGNPVEGLVADADDDVVEVDL
jgi:hypothetical protein